MVISEQKYKIIKEFPNISKTSSNRYLRLLAVSRLFLDNIPIFKVLGNSGGYIGQIGGYFGGAND